MVSNPWNLETGNQFLQRSWLGREVYSKIMGKNLKKVFEESVTNEATFPIVTRLIDLTQSC